MLKNKFLRLSLMSTLLVTTVLGAGTQNCASGSCFVNLGKSSLSIPKKKVINLTSLNQSIYIQKMIDKSIAIVLDGETISVFPSYVMTEEEKVNYFDNKKANEDLLKLTQIVEKTEDKILEKSNLPSSEFYCEKETKPFYNKILDYFQCV